MIRHVVLMKFTEGTSADTIAEIVTALERFGSALTVLRSYQVGPDLGLSPDSDDFAVVADFADIAGYEKYRDHPEHQRILAEMIRPVLTSRHAVQYEVT